VARFSGSIPPGGEGWITLKVNTRGYRGTVTKSARVYSNDPTNKQITLSMRIGVLEVISVSQYKIYLRGKEGENISGSVIVEAKMEKPLELKPEIFKLMDTINYDIEEIEKGKRYKVIFKNAEGVTGSYSGKLRIMTNYPEKPEILIYVYMNIQKDAEDIKKGN